MNKKIIIILAIVTLLFISTAVVLLLSGPRMKQQPSLQAFEAKVPLPPEDAVPFHATETASLTITFLTANKETLYRGKVYYGYYCVFCHGENGKGNGPVGESYLPKPADLTRPSLQNKTAAELYDASFTGTGHSPVLQRIVPPAHRNYLITYIREEFQNSR